MEFIKDIAAVVNEQGSKSVALQLPDWMLEDAADFCD